MSTSCDAFRARLEDALAHGAGLALLAQHAHVGACAHCRAALVRERKLDELLERVPADAAPTSLAGRVLAGLAQERARPTPPTAEPVPGELPPGALLPDELLNELLDELPAPQIPVGLSARVLASVAGARTPRRRLRWLLVAAAVLAALGMWAWSARRADESLEVAQNEALALESDPELLAYAVERWELLHDEDLDVWLASLDPLDEVLLEFAGDATWPVDGPEEGD